MSITNRLRANWQPLSLVALALVVIVLGVVWRPSRVTLREEVRPSRVSSTVPGHGEFFAEQPYEIVIVSSTPITVPSSITLTRQGKDGEVFAASGSLDADALAVRAPVSNHLNDGIYDVSYRVCVAQDCQDGSFSFILNRLKITAFTDLREQGDITLHIDDLALDHPNIIIGAGTAVTWVNDGDVACVIESDPYPSHAFLPALHTSELSPGSSGAFTFTATGEFPYHCVSPSGDRGYGSIIVR